MENRIYCADGYVPTKNRFAFYDTDKDRTLVMSDKKPKGFSFFTDEATIEETLWAEGCKRVIEREEAKRNEHFYYDAMSDLLERFEKKLSEERENKAKGNGA